MNKEAILGELEKAIRQDSVNEAWLAWILGTMKEYLNSLPENDYTYQWEHLSEEEKHKWVEKTETEIAKRIINEYLGEEHKYLSLGLQAPIGELWNWLGQQEEE